MFSKIIPKNRTTIRNVARLRMTDTDARLSLSLRSSFSNHFSTTAGKVAVPTKTPGKDTPPAVAQRLVGHDSILAVRPFPEFEIAGNVVVVTGGAQGLGLEIAVRLTQAGVHAHVFDIKAQPSKEFYEQQELLASNPGSGSLTYHQVEVNIENDEAVELAFAKVADQHGRLDGLVAAAAVQFVKPITGYPAAEVTRMMNINYGGVWISAKSAAKQMVKYGCPGSIVFVGSMSGLIANRDLYCSVYNSSKAAVIQLGRSLAMEFGQIIKTEGGMKPIRVNVVSPGNIVTPMVLQNFKEDPSLKAKWEGWNMLGRLSQPHEYTGAIVFLLSDASSFMTGSNLVIDGGYTAW